MDIAGEGRRNEQTIVASVGALPGVLLAVGSLTAGGTAVVRRIAAKAPAPPSATRSGPAPEPPAAPPLLTASE